MTAFPELDEQPDNRPVQPSWQWVLTGFVLFVVAVALAMWWGTA